MYTFMNCRAGRVTVAVMLTALAACADEPSPTAPTLLPRPQLAVGDVLMVTNTSGGTDVGSLRWALSYVTGGEVIRFAPELAGQTITLDTTIVMAGKSFTIEGPAGGGITVSGGGAVRVFDITLGSGEEAVLRNLTIANGKHTGSGAGIVMRGSSDSWLRVENSTITGHAAFSWPAIAGVSTLLVNTTVSGNTSTTTTSTSPTVLSTRLTLVNSTIAHNVGAGVNSGALVLRNSIISNNSDDNCTNGSLLNTYEGKNLSDDDTCGGPLEIAIADPQLSPLADNGGPSRTHAISVGSPAINAGAACSVTVDQRYAPRDAQCDLGAFEFADFTTVDLTMASSAAVDLNGWAVVTGTVRCSRNEVFDLRVRLHQSQKTGRGTIDVEATATTPIVCTTGVRSWSVSVGASGQPFEMGTVLAGASTVTAEPWITPVSLSQSVKLYKGRK
jgi:hypothetical protein